MEINDIPHFMDKDEWYFYDEKEHRYKLTERAPETARKIYEEFYRLIETDENDDYRAVRKDCFFICLFGTAGAKEQDCKRREWPTKNKRSERSKEQ